MIKVGPFGGCGRGKAWDDKGRDKIAQIFVSHGDQIFNLQFSYVENGTLVMSERRGSGSESAAPKFDMVTLDYPSEFLTRISGSYGTRGGDQIVSSIAFTTNVRTYGTFGRRGKENCYDCAEDTVFDCQLGEINAFGGFHGSATGNYLISIGVYAKPLTTLTGVNSGTKGQVIHVKKEKAWERSVMSRYQIHPLDY